MKARYIILVLICLGGAVALWHFRARSSPAPRPEGKAAPAAAQPDTPKVPQPEPEKVYAAPKVTDSRLARLVDRDAAIGERVTPDITSRIPRVDHPEDFPPLVAVLLDPKDSDTARNEVANLLERSNYPGVADALCKVLDNPAEKPRFRSFAAQHLGMLLTGAGSKPALQNHPQGAPSLPAPLPPGEREVREKAAAKLHECLADRHVEVRREALLALVRIKDPQAIELAVRWLQPETTNLKPETQVLDLAIRCVHELDLREHIPTVRKYLHDPNEVVRIAAIVALSQWGDEESRPAFEEAANSKSVRLQRAGQAALRRLDQAKRADTETKGRTTH